MSRRRSEVFGELALGSRQGHADRIRCELEHCRDLSRFQPLPGPQANDVGLAVGECGDRGRSAPQRTVGRPPWTSFLVVPRSARRDGAVARLDGDDWRACGARRRSTRGVVRSARRRDAAIRRAGCRRAHPTRRARWCVGGDSAAAARRRRRPRLRSGRADPGRPVLHPSSRHPSVRHRRHPVSWTKPVLRDSAGFSEVACRGGRRRSHRRARRLAPGRVRRAW
jgi:hypothetical protein